MKILRFSLIILLISLANTCAVSASQFQPWSEKVFTLVEQEYGEEAAKRLRTLHNMARDNQDLPVNEKLQLVNDTLNSLPWIADREHWKTADYWATPLETIATFGGDCEDIAVAKWVVLRYFGISRDHLRLAYVKIKKTGEDHIVLLYVDKPEAPPGEQGILVLDNYTSEIKPGPERKDLLAIFITDADDNVTLLSDNSGERTIKGVYQGRKVRNLDDLKKKIAENQRKLEELNKSNQ